MLADKARPKLMSTRLLILIVPVLCLALQPVARGAEARAALEKVGISKGICVVLGLPETDGPESVVNLAGGSELLVYFQSADAEEVARVRRSAETAGLLGERVFVDGGDGRSIHLADNLAGAVLAAPAAEG